MRGLVAALLALAVLAGLSATLLSNPATTHPTEKYLREGVTVEYTQTNLGIAKLLKPRIHVTDLAGRRIAGIIVNVFAGMPRARIAYLGSVAGEGGSAVLTPSILGKVRTYLMPEWRSVLGSVWGFKDALLIFIDALIPAKGGEFKVYSFVKTVPINLGLLDSGFKLLSIRVTVNTSAVRPVEVLRAGNLSMHAAAGRNGGAVVSAVKAEGTEVGKGCVTLFCGKFACLCYCSKWVLERTYAHIENKLIPVVMARWARKYYTVPQAVFFTTLAFSFNDTVMNWFRIYASARISGSPHVTLLQWESFTNKFDFNYAETFFNSRWVSKEPSFKDDAVVAIGFTGSATLGEFRKYEAHCYCGLTKPECSDSDYRATSVTANITVMDVSVKKSGGKWVGTYGYLIDDDLSDGRGLQRLWALMMKHSKSAGMKAGVGRVWYFYTGSKTSEVDMGVDVGDMVAWLITEGAAKVTSWIKDFPLDVGIDWGVKEVINGAIFLNSISYYSNYLMFLTTYESRDKVYLGNEEVSLKLMCFDIDVYPPSGV